MNQNNHRRGCISPLDAGIPCRTSDARSKFLKSTKSPLTRVYRCSRPRRGYVKNHRAGFKRDRGRGEAYARARTQSMNEIFSEASRRRRRADDDDSTLARSSRTHSSQFFHNRMHAAANTLRIFCFLFCKCGVRSIQIFG